MNSSVSRAPVSSVGDGSLDGGTLVTTEDGAVLGTVFGWVPMPSTAYPRPEHHDRRDAADQQRRLAR